MLLHGSVTVRGIGIHSGEMATVRLHPSESGGYRIRVGSTEFAAHFSHVVDTSRCTVLGSGSVQVSTVEHLLSALLGMGISHCVIEVTGSELPIGDGSATIWTDALQEAGFYGVPLLLKPIPSQIQFSTEGGLRLFAFAL